MTLRTFTGRSMMLLGGFVVLLTTVGRIAHDCFLLDSTILVLLFAGPAVSRGSPSGT